MASDRDQDRPRPGHSGTRSTFGPQVLSHRTSGGGVKFGTSGRTIKLYTPEISQLNLGRTAPHLDTDMHSSFGQQPLGQKINAPSFKFGGRVQSGRDKQQVPGPGAYAGDDTKVSQRARSATFRIGTSTRFAEPKSVSPGYTHDPKLAHGNMGDGPRMTMGFGRRYNAVDGVPGQKPTYVSAPGPGAYEVVAKDSAFGTPALANRSTSPTTRIGNATRQAERKKFEPEFERDLLGQHSPPPTTYLPPADVGFPRKIRAPSAKFGTAFRWSIGGSTVYKAGSGKQPPRAKEVVPGPGQYVV